MKRTAKHTWGRLLEALVLVRLGQELGSDSRVARAVHDGIEIILALLK